MSKTHPSKAKKAGKSGAAKGAVKNTPKKAPVKAVAKKAPVQKKAASKVFKKPVSKKAAQPAKKTAVSKKVAAVKKVAPAKKTTPAKKAPQAKKAAAPIKKVVSVKHAVVVKKATPVKKAPVKNGKSAPAKSESVKTKAGPAKSESKKVSPAPAKKAVAPAKVNEAPKAKAVSEAAVAIAVSVPAPGDTKPASPAKALAKPTSKNAKNAVPAPAAEPLSPPRPPVISDEKPVALASGALFYDSHMHTPLCKHAWGEPEEYAEQALKAGLKGIIFTCHCPMPDGFWPSVRMSDSEFDTYLAIVQRTAEAYRGKLDVCLGLESEFFPGHEKWIENLHQRADFDYILGGLHWQSKEYLGKHEIGTIENFRRTYFEHLAQSAETGLYDCIAHPDLVKNYHPDSWCFAIIKNTVASVLDRIAKTGVAMELNTSGLNKSYSEMNPGNEMLRMMAERKIPIVIGSDAHKALRVGEHFITALNNLLEAGFENVSYFRKRQRIDLKISDVLASLRKAIDANS